MDYYVSKTSSLGYIDIVLLTVSSLCMVEILLAVLSHSVD